MLIDPGYPDGRPRKRRFGRHCGKAATTFRDAADVAALGSSYGLRENDEQRRTEMSSHSGTIPARQREAQTGSGGSSAVWKVVVLLLGIAVGVLAIAAVVAVQAADEARDEATAGGAAPATATHDHSTHASTATTSGESLPLQSFAGTTAPNADALAKAHVAYDATLPPVPAGDLVKVHMTLKDMTVEIAPGVKYNTWAFDGHGAPGPIVHVRAGPDGPDDADERRRDPALDRLPRRPHRPERRVQGRRAGRVVHVPLRRERSRASSCTTAARSPCSRTSRTGCTARSSSSPRRRSRRPTTSTSSSRASGT